MPDLERQIEDWRRRMLAAGVKAPVPLDELEEHLREDVEAQMRVGADEPSAFTIAVQRIGSATEIKDEFQKNVPAKTMKQHITYVLVIIALFANSAALILPVLAKWRMGGALAGANLAQLAVGAAIAGWGVLCGAMAVVAALRKRRQA